MRSTKILLIWSVTAGVVLSLLGLWVGANEVLRPDAPAQRESIESQLPAVTGFESEPLHINPVITF